MAQCTTCGAYTKYEGGLCLDCYTRKKKSDGKKEGETKEGGLSARDHSFRYNMIKGRIAETLIQELFLSLDFNVFRYGMENTIPGIMTLLRGVRSDVSEQIKRMPDFVIQHHTRKDVYFIEVKFRASGAFSVDDLPRDYPYENAYIIIVSKKHIKCITVEELRAGKEITATSQNYLGYRKEFELDKQTIIDFCNFAVLFFENVEDPKERS